MQRFECKDGNELIMVDHQEIGSQSIFLLEADCYILVCSCMFRPKNLKEGKWMERKFCITNLIKHFNWMPQVGDRAPFSYVQESGEKLLKKEQIKICWLTLYLGVFCGLFVGLCIMADGSMPYVGMALKKLVATLKVHKWHVRNVCVKLVKGLHESYQAFIECLHE